MEKIDKLKSTLDEILSFMSINPAVAIEEADVNSYTIKIEGENLNFLIGYRGESLESLQNLLNLIMYKQLNDWMRVVVDINGYRTQKQEKIEQIAKGFIDRVRFLAKDVEMPPMSPSERRLVHVFLQEYDDVTSESIGIGQNRRVVLKPKKKE